MQFSLENVLVDDERVVIGKGVDSRDHLVNQNAQSPPINRLPMALILEDLRGKVLGSAAKSESSILYLFGEAEICQFEVSVSSDKNILGF